MVLFMYYQNCVWFTKKKIGWWRRLFICVSKKICTLHMHVSIHQGESGTSPIIYRHRAIYMASCNCVTSKKRKVLTTRCNKISSVIIKDKIILWYFKVFNLNHGDLTPIRNLKIQYRCIFPDNHGFIRVSNAMWVCISWSWLCKVTKNWCSFLIYSLELYLITIFLSRPFWKLICYSLY